jgi:hypothetical protein
VAAAAAVACYALRDRAGAAGTGAQRQ